MSDFLKIVVGAGVECKCQGLNYYYIYTGSNEFYIALSSISMVKFDEAACYFKINGSMPSDEWMGITFSSDAMDEYERIKRSILG